MIEVRLPLPLRKPRSKPQAAALSCPAVFLKYGGAVGSLKGLGLDTPIPTITGWTTMRDIQVGETIFDRDGLPCKVIGTSEVFLDKPTYEIEFDNGEKVIASHDHLWLTMTQNERNGLHRRTPEFRAARRAKRPSRSTGKRPDVIEKNKAMIPKTLAPPAAKIRTSDEVFNTRFSRKEYPNHSIDVAGRIQCEEAILPIDPYVLGYWLGNGSQAGSRITIPDADVRAELDMRGYPSRHEAKYYYYIYNLHRTLRLAGLKKNKHIPTAYFRASVNQRTELLQGLMDSDGTAVTKGSVFYNTSQKLIDGFKELGNSLGLKTGFSSYRAKLNGKDCGPAYSVCFVSDFPVHRLPRKAKRQKFRERLTASRHYIVRIEKTVEPVPTRCIMVDSPSQTYLFSRSFIPTHNTSTAIEAAAQFRDNPRMHSIILRRTAPELKDLMNEAAMLYAQAGGRMNWSDNEYRFASGARVWFGYAQRDKEIHRYMGPRFSFVNFDESTFFGEYAIRFMFSRLGSVDSQLPLRLWLTTNPGGLSGSLHMHIFQGKLCLHCIAEDIAAGRMSEWPKDARHPFKLYRDATWESDKKPIWDKELFPDTPITTCYIPGKLTDHDLFGKDGSRYSGLGALTVEMREAYKAGCWAKFEGQYYDIWNPQVHVVPRLSIKEQSWWHFWTGNDYGFKKSWATSHLFCRNPEGRIYVMEEKAENKWKAKDFGRAVYDWETSRGYNVIANYLSPDAWAERGDDQTLADQAQECGISFSTASNDRAGGSMLIYTMLSDGMLYVADTCPLLIKAIPTRIHDEKDPMSYAKTPTPEDDAMDDFRYGLYSHCREPREPKELRIARKVTSDDPTVQAIQAQVAQRQVDEEDGNQEQDYMDEAPWRSSW